MPESRGTQELKQCMKAATTQAQRDACQARSSRAQGATTTGGKVFGTADGNGVFVTDGGKVFGGKVF